MTVENPKTSSFLDELVELCKKHEVEMSGCFAVYSRDEPPVRNIEQVNEQGVVRTTNRGNRL